MLIYEYRLRDEFDRVRAYAKRVHDAVESGRSPEELLLDVQNLQALCEGLREMLPAEVRDQTNLGRHLHFLRYYLERGQIDNCRSDILDIHRMDLPALEAAFREWVRSSGNYDPQLVREVSDLVIKREYDSAVRKAFVVLRTRIAKHFGVEDGRLDGEALVNHLFGSNPHPKLQLTEPERQAWRNLLAGFFGVFRNRFAHEELRAEWHEADAVLALVNHVLRSLDEIAPSDQGTAA